MTEPLRCSRCGAPLAQATSGVICPACLLKLGLAGSDAGETTLASTGSDETVMASRPDADATRLTPRPDPDATVMAKPTSAIDITPGPTGARVMFRTWDGAARR